MDQSHRYVDLSLNEHTLLRNGQHILAAYRMTPKPGHGYIEAAAHFAAESSTGTNVEVVTTDDFTRGVDALVYHANEATGDLRLAYPLELFDRNMTDGRMMMVSFLTLAVGNNQGMGDIAHAKLIDFHVPPSALALFDGPSRDISDLWRALGRPVRDGGFIVGTIIKPKLGLRPERFAQAAYEFWLGGDFIKNDEPQGNQTFAPMKRVIPVVNLEWIQKIHRDRATRGYSTEAVTDVILRRMPDYVHYIVPQFQRTHVNFQRVPVVDTSNPFIARTIPTADESLVVIRFADPRGIDFPYLLSMLHDSWMSRANTIVCPGGKMELAMQLIFTPLIMRLVERRKKALGG